MGVECCKIYETDLSNKTNNDQINEMNLKRNNINDSDMNVKRTRIRKGKRLIFSI